MELYKAKLVAMISLVLFFPSSFCTSIDNDMKRLVPSGPDPIKSPPTPFFKRHPSNIRKLYEFDIKRRVPKGPDPIKSPPTPISNPYEISPPGRV